jgi:hypothetical protein
MVTWWADPMTVRGLPGLFILRGFIMSGFFSSEQDYKEFLEHNIDSSENWIELDKKNLKNAKEALQNSLKQLKKWQDCYAERYGKATLKKYVLKSKKEKILKIEKEAKEQILETAKGLPKKDKDINTDIKPFSVIKGGINHGLHN